MGEVSEPVVSCESCGAELSSRRAHASTSASLVRRAARCADTVAITVSETITVREQLRLKAKSLGEKRPFMEQKAGDDYSRSRGRWMKLRRVIDRRDNRHQETIEDPDTCEVIRDVDEPLTDHVGRGSAKPKPPG